MRRHDIAASIVECYNESVWDLLAPGGKREVELVKCPGGFDMPDLTRIGAHCSFPLKTSFAPLPADQKPTNCPCSTSVPGRQMGWKLLQGDSNLSAPQRPHRRCSVCLYCSRTQVRSSSILRDMHASYRAFWGAGVTSPEQVHGIMAAGFEQRSVGRHDINAHSSRSHCALVIHAASTDAVTGVRTVGKLTLCDLAGSERINNDRRYRCALRLNQTRF